MGTGTGKIGNNMIFWRKIVIFHTKYPKNFRASLMVIFSDYKSEWFDQSGG
jgi:hypothetical protein